MTDEYVTVHRNLLREAERLIYRLADKVGPKKISQDFSLEMAVVLTGLRLAMTKRAAE